MYRQYVLSCIITGSDVELGWRRNLWENFYPRIRQQNTTHEAAKVVVQFLRQRVTIAPDAVAKPGVETMWNSQIVNRADFEILYVATLRSVGVPARLNSSSKKAEFWNGRNWETAPQLTMTTLE